MVCALHPTPEPQHCADLLTRSHSALSFTFPALLYGTGCGCSTLNSPLVATHPFLRLCCSELCEGQ